MPRRSRKGLTPNQELDELHDFGLIVVHVSITADASAGQSFKVPCAMEILDVIVQSRATVGSATATVRKSTTAITNAIVMATDTNITRAGTIDDAQSTVLPSESLNVKTNAAGDRGLVTIIGRRV